MVNLEATSARKISFDGKDYWVDSENYLMAPGDWDEDFAQGMAPEAGIVLGLNERHWEVIRFIRRFWGERGCCPTVYQTCRILGLHIAGFSFLFPAGYRRGACKLAGISHKEELPEGTRGSSAQAPGSYCIDLWGFLLDPDEWDERFALLRAHELKVPGGLTNEHWRVLRFLRQEYFRIGKVPTVSQTCEALGLDLEGLENLFPDGYHRGAVKIAGLCARI